MPRVNPRGPWRAATCQTALWSPGGFHWDPLVTSMEGFYLGLSLVDVLHSAVKTWIPLVTSWPYRHLLEATDIGNNHQHFPPDRRPPAQCLRSPRAHPRAETSSHRAFVIVGKSIQLGIFLSSGFAAAVDLSPDLFLCSAVSGLCGGAAGCRKSGFTSHPRSALPSVPLLQKDCRSHERGSPLPPVLVSPSPDPPPPPPGQCRKS